MEDKEYEFVHETIKKKPVNKKKLLRRTVLTAAFAVVFGLVACVTFLLLEPVINNILNPEKISKVEFPEEKKEGHLRIRKIKRIIFSRPAIHV